MADEPAKPRRLTVYAEAAAVLALVVAVIGVVVAVFAFEHDKEVATGSPGATPVITVTQYVPSRDAQEPEKTSSSSPGFWGGVGVVVLTILTGLFSSFLVFMSWEELVISDFIVFLITVAIAGAHAFALSFLGITSVWAIILAIMFAAIGFVANVFAG
ncbi:hypothetical protein ACWGH8_37385 [Nonomuraea muscovyensis]|uniref:Cytochrome c oxidase subunit IV n=1 Tax=Nonomuraea muscovyensis TaxID=1124761 RepID=A0A7X0C2D7_9ACTN|nr:hypothetical protein [Nonomuraea muscovyensis]MBB6346230.1 cytochrome c oxidase subunit IV [Nonomuraea muscovyensis]